jgi:flagellar biosynthesis/type III secretory pathway protein FliH
MSECQYKFDCKNAGKFDACLFRTTGLTCVEYKSIQYELGRAAERKELEDGFVDSWSDKVKKIIKKIRETNFKNGEKIGFDKGYSAAVMKNAERDKQCLETMKAAVKRIRNDYETTGDCGVMYNERMKYDGALKLLIAAIAALEKKVEK